MSKRKESKSSGSKSPLALPTTEPFKELVKEIIREKLATVEAESVESSKTGNYGGHMRWYTLGMDRIEVT